MTQGDLFCWVVTVCACIGLAAFTGWVVTYLVSDVKKTYRRNDKW